jgi:hypothetical protein
MKHHDLRLLRHLCTFWPVEPARACLVRSCRLRSRAREHASSDLADLDLGDAHKCQKRPVNGAMKLQKGPTDTSRSEVTLQVRHVGASVDSGIGRGEEEI